MIHRNPFRFRNPLLLALSCLLPLLSSPYSQAQEPGLVLGMPVLAGDGCDSDSAAAALSPDGSELSILFDRFSAEAGGASGKRHDRKTCSIDLKLTAPPGQQVTLAQVDYRGFQSAPDRAQTQVGVSYSFQERPGPSFIRRYVGPMEDEFFVSQTLSTRDAAAWTSCGGTTRLRLTASVLTTTNAHGESSIASIDSADLSGGVTYRLAYRPCSNPGGRTPPPGTKPRVVPGGGPSGPPRGR